ncbi:MAG: tRNA (adenine-N(6)-)-methyltransferase, partial [bacterium]
TFNFDCIITNPPYSLKEEFLERAYSFNKPFAFLMPITALEGKTRQDLYKKYGLQLLIPNKRINFETPSGKGSGSWFASAWFTYKFNLPKDIMFEVL